MKKTSFFEKKELVSIFYNSHKNSILFVFLLQVVHYGFNFSYFIRFPNSKDTKTSGYTARLVKIACRNLLFFCMIFVSIEKMLQMVHCRRLCNSRIVCRCRSRSRGKRCWYHLKIPLIISATSNMSNTTATHAIPSNTNSPYSMYVPA